MALPVSHTLEITILVVTHMQEYARMDGREAFVEAAELVLAQLFRDRDDNVMRSVAMRSSEEAQTIMTFIGEDIALLSSSVRLELALLIVQPIQRTDLASAVDYFNDSLDDEAPTETTRPGSQPDSESHQDTLHDDSDTDDEEVASESSDSLEDAYFSALEDPVDDEPADWERPASAGRSIRRVSLVAPQRGRLRQFPRRVGDICSRD